MTVAPVINPAHEKFAVACGCSACQDGPAHGTWTRYGRHHCRCEECKELARAAKRRWKANRRAARPVEVREYQTENPIYCGRCGEEIEACYGRDSDWMHTGTRRERCNNGALARPETANELVARLRKRYTANG